MKEASLQEYDLKANWNDWLWQLKHRLTSAEELSTFLTLTPLETQALAKEVPFTHGVTPYILSKMDPKDPDCPIRKQFIPSLKEKEKHSMELIDPCGEDKHSPVAGIVHRYPDRVLFLACGVCASYCRYCTRSRLVGHPQNIPHSLEPAYQYIESHPEIRDVLISGGDPLLLSDQKLESILSRLSSIPHLEILRIGTRAPITLPQRITPSLVSMMQNYHPIFISLHVNHHKELTPEVKVATDRLLKGGFPLGSQTVLLKGINDDGEIMKQLMHELLKLRIKPYYLYQCDPVPGTSHFRTSITKGTEIIRKLRGHTSGYAIPTYVIDAPGGGGKIPMEPNNIIRQGDGVLYLQNFSGEIFKYHEFSSKEDQGK